MLEWVAPASCTSAELCQKFLLQIQEFLCVWPLQAHQPQCHGLFEHQRHHTAAKGQSNTGTSVSGSPLEMEN